MLRSSTTLNRAAQVGLHPPPSAAVFVAGCFLSTSVRKRPATPVATHLRDRPSPDPVRLSAAGSGDEPVRYHGTIAALPSETLRSVQEDDADSRVQVTDAERCARLSRRKASDHRKVIDDIGEACVGSSTAECACRSAWTARGGGVEARLASEHVPATIHGGPTARQHAAFERRT